MRRLQGINIHMGVDFLAEKVITVISQLVPPNPRTSKTLL